MVGEGWEWSRLQAVWRRGTHPSSRTQPPHPPLPRLRAPLGRHLEAGVGTDWFGVFPPLYRGVCNTQPYTRNVLLYMGGDMGLKMDPGEKNKEEEKVRGPPWEEGALASTNPKCNCFIHMGKRWLRCSSANIGV